MVHLPIRIKLYIDQYERLRIIIQYRFFHEKLDPRAMRCVFTGYPTSPNALIPLQKESMSLWMLLDFQINPIFMTQPKNAELVQQVEDLKIVKCIILTRNGKGKKYMEV